jgi:predicted nucleotidyltransferase
LLDNAAAKLQNNSAILGVLLGGSIATGKPDHFSDIDLYLIVRDEDLKTVFADRELYKF